MNKPILFHNPRCSKSREAKALLEEKGIDHETRLYLEDKLSKDEIKDILSKGITIEELTRKNEGPYKDLIKELGTVTEDDIINLFTTSPKTFQRPILINKDKAIIGRPPEDILTIL